MQIKEQKTVEINGTSYLITAMDAMYGLDVMNQIEEYAVQGQNPPAIFIKGVVTKTVTANNMAVNDGWFNTHFARNYKELFQLFNEICEFNFGEALNSPNESSDTSEE